MESRKINNISTFPNNVTDQFVL